MVKEQKRGNKEARKPKGDKKAKKAEALASASALMAAGAPLGRQSKSKG